MKIFSIIGLLAGIMSVILWFILSFFNPYSNLMEWEPIVNTFFFLFLPACLAIYSSIKARNTFMLIAFIWSFPLSLYLMLTPGIFILFGLTNVIYLVSYLFIRWKKKRE